MARSDVSLGRFDFHFILILALWMGAGWELRPQQARAETYTLDLTDVSLYDAAGSTGIWNPASGRIEAAYAKNSTAGQELNFGSGEDGAFVNGPAQTGITVSGTAITINTSVKSVYQFSSFQLDAGYTITVTGSNPLVIRNLGTTTIAGTIQANGGVGDATAATSSGGAGRAGGGSGGAGASSGSDGGPTSGPSRGGSGGLVNALTEEGGGGGCNGAGPDAGMDAAGGSGGGGGVAGACGSTRTAVADALEATFQAGAGGGGGGEYTGGGSGGPFQGAGGGGGGGALRWVSLGAVSVTGAIEAKGGAGGENDTVGSGGHCDGAGGGGSGGTIWIQSASTVTGGGTANVTRGLGGGKANCGGAWDGGNGSRGLIRIDTTSGAQTLTITPGGGNLGDGRDGTAAVTVGRPVGETYTIYTRALEFDHGYWDFVSAAETTNACGSSGSITVTYEGSRDGSNWIVQSIAGSNISQLSDYPYIRAKVVIVTGAAAPYCLSALSIEYQPKLLTDLTLSGGLFCTALSTTRVGDRASPWAMLGDVFLILLAGLLSRLPRRRAVGWL